MAIHPLLQLPVAHITLQHTYKGMDIRQPLFRYSDFWFRWKWSITPPPPPQRGDNPPPPSRKKGDTPPIWGDKTNPYISTISCNN